MYHSITFGDKNTWDDWCLIPNGRPIFAPPTQKTNYLDVPGANGSLDMSEALTGYPVFNNREGSFSFIIMNKNASHYPECRPLKLDDTYSEVMGYLHGKRMRAILEDDPGFFYEGRFSVGSVSPGADWSTIEIGYNVHPYKKAIKSSVDDWEWDPFNFETGVIYESMFENIQVSTTKKTITIPNVFIGEEPICPNFRVTAANGQGVYIGIYNEALSIDTRQNPHLFPVGLSQSSDYILYGGNVVLELQTSSGTGTVSIEFYRGIL